MKALLISLVIQVALWNGPLVASLLRAALPCLAVAATAMQCFGTGLIALVAYLVLAVAEFGK